MAANAALRSQEISTDHCLTLKLMAHRVNNDGLRYSNQRVGDLVALIRAESGASAEQVRAAFDRFQSFIISGHVESSSNSHAATTKRERLTDEERIIVRQKRLEALVTGNESGGLSMAALAKRFAVSEYQIAATQAWLTIAPMRALPKALRGQPLPLHDVIGEIQKAVFTAFTAGKEQVDGRTACGIANRFGLMRDQDKIVEACARLFEMIK